jgi:hypothetical protein
MRSNILTYIKSLKLGTYSTSDELPWDNNGTPLYQTNLRRIYVDVAQFDQNSRIDTLGMSGAVDEITTVQVYFVNDAKTLPSNYESLVEDIKQARVQDYTAGYTQKLCQVSTAFVSDRVLTTFEFSFRKLMTN